MWTRQASDTARCQLAAWLAEHQKQARRDKRQHWREWCGRALPNGGGAACAYAKPEAPAEITHTTIRRRTVFQPNALAE